MSHPRNGLAHVMYLLKSSTNSTWDENCYFLLSTIENPNQRLWGNIFDHIFSIQANLRKFRDSLSPAHFRSHFELILFLFLFPSEAANELGVPHKNPSIFFSNHSRFLGVFNKLSLKRFYRMDMSTKNWIIVVNKTKGKSMKVPSEVRKKDNVFGTARQCCCFYFDCCNVYLYIFFQLLVCRLAYSPSHKCTYLENESHAAPSRHSFIDQIVSAPLQGLRRQMPGDTFGSGYGTQYAMPATVSPAEGVG